MFNKKKDKQTIANTMQDTVKETAEKNNIHCFMITAYDCEERVGTGLLFESHDSEKFAEAIISSPKETQEAIFKICLSIVDLLKDDER